MKFKQFRGIFQEHVKSMTKGHTHLFTTDTNKDELWEAYLDGFPEGTNEIFRKRRGFDCSCCRAFIKQFGNVVTITDNKITTIWDFQASSEIYQPVINTLSAMVKSAPIKRILATKQAGFGTDYSNESLGDGSRHTWSHFRIVLPDRFVFESHKTEAALEAQFRDSYGLFERFLEEITKDAIETILDLTAEKALYKGEEWQAVLAGLLGLHNEYHALPDDEKNNFCWGTSTRISDISARVFNTSIGVLLKDISKGVDITEAVRKYESLVAPQNYKRPKEIFTREMVTSAEAAITRLGLSDSLGRRHANLKDITPNNVLWANRDAIKEMQSIGIFDELRQDVAVTDPKRFEKVKGVSIEHFIKDILPTATSISVLLENRHEASLMSLIAPKIKNAPSLFKWSNALCHVYNGNVADSLKQRVKAAGGDIDGVLRLSLQWNINRDNQNDFDAHCVEPGGNHIYYPNKGTRHPSTGILDVDIVNPGSHVAVENITWSDVGKMREGIYVFYIKNYSHNGGRSGFTAEIEYNGQIHEYDYSRELGQGEEVIVARFEFTKQNGIKFLDSLPSQSSSKEIWSLKTNQFHAVSACMLSPNYWDEQRGIGHKHYLFMLAGCTNDSRPNGFFNEYLREEFMEQKRVFAALGSKMKVEQSSNQLSGVGFSSTKRNSLITKIDGKKIIKVIF